MACKTMIARRYGKAIPVHIANCNVLKAVSHEGVLVVRSPPPVAPMPWMMIFAAGTCGLRMVMERIESSVESPAFVYRYRHSGTH